LIDRFPKENVVESDQSYQQNKFESRHMTDECFSLIVHLLLNAHTLQSLSVYVHSKRKLSYTHEV